MSMLKTITMVLCCALLFAIFPARADQQDKKTIMTFSQAVEIPGVVLPAGTYVFKLADSSANRHIVQVFNEDQTEIHATLLAIANYRLDPPEETVVEFEERAEGSPRAIHAWFYPGESYGWEFVYPE